MRIVLIGPRGCGKSLIGRNLAQRLHCAFSDLDDLTLAEFAEPTVAAIWQSHGEAAWRTAEVRVLRKLLHEAAGTSVLALGGGTPIIPEARAALLSEHDLYIVYLRCSSTELARRLSQEPGDRPSITGRGSLQEVGEVLAAREPVYESLAHSVIEADHAAGQVVESILRILPDEGRPPGQ